MTRRPKDIGTDAERAVVRYLQTHGFEGAERRALRGTKDAGDITGCPSLCIEVKGGNAARNASDNQITAWLQETEKERDNAGAEIGLLVVQRRGVGPANAGRWWAVLTVDAIRVIFDGPFSDLGPYDLPVRMLLADAITLLRAAGYGTTPTRQEVTT